jgi:pimeloyl-ACP methyl ester carboxylesterase
VRAVDATVRGLALHCTGEGTPAVVLEPGLGADHRAWELVQPELAETTRVCSYDRAGLGSSMPVSGPRTIDDLVDDLHALLLGAGIDGPRVLVGHSFGGILVRMYASKHPGAVAGVVLVDSAHPDQIQRLVATLPKFLPGRRRLAAELDKMLLRTEPNEEGIDIPAAFAQTRRVGPLPDTPLVVITAAEKDNSGLGRAMKKRCDRAWFSMQQELAALSNDSVHVIATTSGHDVMSPLGQPRLVAAAIREVVRSVRTDTPLASCADVFAPLGGQCVA